MGEREKLIETRCPECRSPELVGRVLKHVEVEVGITGIRVGGDRNDVLWFQMGEVGDAATYDDFCGEVYCYRCGAKWPDWSVIIKQGLVSPDSGSTEPTGGEK